MVALLSEMQSFSSRRREKTMAARNLQVWRKHDARARARRGKGKIQRSEREKKEGWEGFFPRRKRTERGGKRYRPCGILHLRGRKNPTFCGLLVPNDDRFTAFLYLPRVPCLRPDAFSLQAQAFATNFLPFNSTVLLVDSAALLDGTRARPLRKLRVGARNGRINVPKLYLYGHL